MPRVPQREESLARPRSRKGKGAAPVTKGAARETEQPEAPTYWDDGVRDLWLSMGQSGQADFYQASDWAFARIVLDNLNGIRASSRPSAEALRAVYSALDRLLLTEGERRRARIELTAPSPAGTPPAVLAIADYQAAGDMEEDD